MSVLPNDLVEIRQWLAQTSKDGSLTGVVGNLRAQWPLLNNDQVVHIMRSLDSQVGILEPLSIPLSNPNVTDIVINGFADVWIDDGLALKRIDSPWQSESHLKQFAHSLADDCDRRLDVLNPFVDLQLTSGIRAHIVIPPVAQNGTHISLRIPRSSNTAIYSLLSHQGVEVVQLLREIVQARVSFLVCGATGSGKTTLLRALLALVKDSERIVVIEDTQELNLEHPHVVSLQGRTPNSENMGEITMRQLVRQALRMRPDRIVVGEVRGVEIVDLFSALNTGHKGSAATVHANSANDVCSRLHMLGLLAGLSTEAIHTQISSALDIVIEVARCDDKRVVKEIGILHYFDGRSEYQSAMQCWPEVIKTKGYEQLMELIHS